MLFSKDGQDPTVEWMEEQQNPQPNILKGFIVVVCIDLIIAIPTIVAVWWLFSR